MLDERIGLEPAYTSEHGEMVMKGFVDNIEKLTVENTDFRRVLYTGTYPQLMLMTLKPGEEISAGGHPDRD